MKTFHDVRFTKEELLLLRAAMHELRRTATKPEALRRCDNVMFKLIHDHKTYSTAIVHNEDGTYAPQLVEVKQ